MKETAITGNGVFNITLNGGKTLNGESTVYAISPVGSAQIILGWTDEGGGFNAYQEEGVDSALTEGDAKRVRHGTGVFLSVSVSGFTSTFSLGLAPS